MGRKRKSVPQRMNEVKRNRLAWNMQDLAQDVIVIGDDDPALLQEKLSSVRGEPGVGHCGAGPSHSSHSLHEENHSQERLKSNLNHCDFYLSVQDNVEFKETDWNCLIGSFKVLLRCRDRTAPVELPECEEFWLYVSEDPERHLVYFERSKKDDNFDENADNVIWFEASSDISYPCLDGLQLRSFIITKGKYSAETGELELKVVINETALTQLAFSADGGRFRKTQTAMQHIMAFFYGTKFPDYEGKKMTKKHSIEELFEKIKDLHAQEDVRVGVNVQHVALRPRLRHYQKCGVAWMLHKENVGKTEDKDAGKLHPMYEEVKMADGKVLYYNSYGGMLVKAKPLFGISPPGGILADEMGLGKTVEVLACMLCHPRTDLQPVDPLPVIKEEPEEEEIITRKKKRSPRKASRTTFSSQLSLENRMSFDGTINLNGFSSQNSVTGSNISETSSSMSCKTDPTEETSESDAAEDLITKKRVSMATGQVSMAINGSENDMDVILGVQEGKAPVCLDHNYASPTSEQKVSATLSMQGGDKTEENENNPTVNGSSSLEENPAVFEKSSEKSNVLNIESEKQIALTGKSENDEKLDDCQSKKKKKNVLKKKGKKLQKVDDNDIPNKNKKGKETRTVKSKNAKKLNSDITANDGVKSENEIQTNQEVITGKKKRSLEKKRSSKGHVELVEIEEAPEPQFFNTKVEQKSYFECTCGVKNDSQDRKMKVKCEQCGLSQHAKCMNYDLSNPLRGPYLCPHCRVASPPVQSAATLIISPNSISYQWAEEIQKHIHAEKLKVFIYNGVQKQGFIQPQTLASHDIVITTYEMLRQEINYVDLPHTNSEAGRRFRHPKRFMTIPSPIIAVEWWRICLDEAQMVECTTTKTAEMALRLSGVNRWCVTGTPINRTIDDLYGLLLFLGIDPYWVNCWWYRILYEPYCYGEREALETAISQVMWRTSKKDVLDQIGLPVQSEESHWLTFSPVEEHFYRQQYQACARDAMTKLGKWTDQNTKLSSLDRDTLHNLLYPLSKLRQACCHPQAVRGAFINVNKSTLTMEELLMSLIKKTRLESEESHRQIVAALNGLAALYIIQLKYPEAVENYREVLRSIEEHKVNLRTDDLQLLHTLHNLQEVLSLKPDGVDPTLRDANLKMEACELRNKYLVKAAAFVSTSMDAWTPTKKSLKDLQKEFAGGEDWWADLLQWVMWAGLDEQLVYQVKEDLAENTSANVQSMGNKFRDVRGLQYLLGTQLEQLQTSHDHLETALQKLSGQPSQDLINITVECCLRPAKDILKICPFCKADELFESYESKLFSFSEKLTFEGSQGDEMSIATRRQGTWADSETEKALKSLMSFARSYGGDRNLVEHGIVHLKLMEALKKEFRALRKVFMAQKENVSAYDELDMATLRFRLRLPDEPRPDIPQPHILEAAELEAQRLKLMSDKVIGTNDLKKKLGQLLYLKNLEKGQNQLEGGKNPEPCPICQKELGTKWSVLQCGHCYCLECVRILIEQFSFGGRNRSLRCAICRQLTPHPDISYVCTRVKGAEEENDAAVKLKGDMSTKIEGVMKCLIKILHDDPNAKALVFSTWQDVLNILGRSLEENDIDYRSLQASRKFQESLFCFKHVDSVRVLLLPVHSGANGLNLIEATHILLLEPILNPAQELQAIGRVHRIGQTKPTFVHRFLVRGTIEQRMHSLLQTVQAPVNSHNAEETNMTIGDLTSLFQDVATGEEEEEEIGDQTDVIQNLREPSNGLTDNSLEGNEQPMQPSPQGSTIQPQSTPGVTTELLQTCRHRGVEEREQSQNQEYQHSQNITDPGCLLQREDLPKSENTLHGPSVKPCEDESLHREPAAGSSAQSSDPCRMDDVPQIAKPGQADAQTDSDSACLAEMKINADTS